MHLICGEPIFMGFEVHLTNKIKERRNQLSIVQLLTVSFLNELLSDNSQGIVNSFI